jgi:ketosteroid isomerase-like protein
MDLEQVIEQYHGAADEFARGDPSFESFARYVAADLASILEVEQWEAKVGGRDEVTPFVLRVTTTFRREDDAWKLVHRHADPISTPDPEGPLRAT